LLFHFIIVTQDCIFVYHLPEHAVDWSDTVYVCEIM